MKHIPKRLKPVLWSYNIKNMDLETSRNLIIQQVLNHGIWEDVRWLFQTYPRNAICAVIRNPRRGVWFDNVLNFWCRFLNLRLTEAKRTRALFRL